MKQLDSILKMKREVGYPYSKECMISCHPSLGALTLPFCHGCVQSSSPSVGESCKMHLRRR